MFLQLPTQNYNERYALFKITNEKQQLLHVGVCKLSLLTTMNGVQMPQDETMFLTLIQTHVDRMVLANKALLLCHEKGREDLQELITEAVEEWSAPTSNHTIRCIETGETFASAMAASQAHDLTYNQLCRHLNGVKSYNTVKGRTYERLN